MDRRTLLTTGTLAFTGLTAGGVYAQVAKPGEKPHHKMDEMHQKCLELCQHCESVCNQIITHCLSSHGGDHRIHSECARAAITCQDFCGLSAKLMARMDNLSAELCGLCARACEKLQDDPQMKDCAKVCRECSDSCKQMAKSTAR
jgi:hypothetical protein